VTEPAEHHPKVEEQIEERLAELRGDAPVERQMLTRAIGGWRGVIDSALPAIVFITVYALNGQILAPAVWAAVGVGGVIMSWRLLRRQPLTQVVGGFAGVAISALVATRTGQAEDFFLPGLLVNAAYFTVCLVSVLVGWPALGLLLGGLNGSFTRWRSLPEQRRAFAAATWIWVGVFGSRLLVQLPLYFAEQTSALGIAKIVMGWPLFLLGAWLTFLLLRGHLSPATATASAATED
jgi:hypothetical protein